MLVVANVVLVRYIHLLLVLLLLRDTLVQVMVLVLLRLWLMLEAIYLLLGVGCGVALFNLAVVFVVRSLIRPLFGPLVPVGFLLDR